MSRSERRATVLPMGCSDDATGVVLTALSEAIDTIATEPALDLVLNKLAEGARRLAHAKYAAIGIPAPEGDAFDRFVTVGMSDELIERLGPLPRTHGMLGAMLTDTRPFRTADITMDPRFRGWWPVEHPRMRSFLGVPVVTQGTVIGAFYVTEREGGEEFTAEDEARVKLLAGHAAIAIENARLFEASRELALSEERARLARELHDAMSQSLFSLSLSAQAAASLVRRDPERAVEEINRVKELARATMAELRTVVAGLRPADLESDGLVPALRSQLALLERAHGLDIVVTVDGEPDLEPEEEHHVFRVVQEAVTNALRHASASKVGVSITATSGGLIAEVHDDGVGFDPGGSGIGSRRLGLTSMRERAERLGGTLSIVSARGKGTQVRLEVRNG
jgi:signal transduction histidine kinase